MVVMSKTTSTISEVTFSRHLLTVLVNAAICVDELLHVSFGHFWLLRNSATWRMPYHHWTTDKTTLTSFQALSHWDKWINGSFFFILSCLIKNRQNFLFVFIQHQLTLTLTELVFFFFLYSFFSWVSKWISNKTFFLKIIHVYIFKIKYGNIKVN